MIRALFDKDRRNEIQRAIARGEPLPFQRNKIETPAEGIESDVSALIRDIHGSSDTTRQRLERARAFMKNKVKDIVGKHGKDEFAAAQASAEVKMLQAEMPVVVIFTPLERTIVGLLKLNKLIAQLEMQVKSEDGVRKMIGGITQVGKVGP